MRGELIDPMGEVCNPRPIAPEAFLVSTRRLMALLVELRIGPPPAVALHLLGRRHDSVGDRGEIRFRVIQAEDQASGAHPAQGQARRRAGSIEASSYSPTAADNRRSRSWTDWPRAPAASAAASRSFSRRARAFQTSSRPRYRARTGSLSSLVEEFVHGTHHVGMRIERAARKANIRRTIIAKSPHQLVLAANHANRQSAGNGLAVSHHVGAHAEVFLRAAATPGGSRRRLRRRSARCPAACTPRATA